MLNTHVLEEHKKHILRTTTATKRLLQAPAAERFSAPLFSSRFARHYKALRVVVVVVAVGVLCRRDLARHFFPHPEEKPFARKAVGALCRGNLARHFFRDPEENFRSHKTTYMQLLFCTIIGLQNVHTMKFFIFLCRHISIIFTKNKPPRAENRKFLKKPPKKSGALSIKGAWTPFGSFTPLTRE
jgi:hypothetical protein